MDMALSILSRYLHVVPAMLVVGGLVFMRLILPAALERSELSSEAREAVFLRCRRVFKMVVHTSIALLVLSGAYNSYRLWGQYKADTAVFHPLWGTHLLLALVVFGLAIVVTKGERPPAAHRSISAAMLGLLLLLILIASTVKQVREGRLVPHSQAASAPT
jgi:uncharacterized membrane protein